MNPDLERSRRDKEPCYGQKTTFDRHDLLRRQDMLAHRNGREPADDKIWQISKAESHVLSCRTLIHSWSDKTDMFARCEFQGPRDRGYFQEHKRLKPNVTALSEPLARPGELE